MTRVLIVLATCLLLSQPAVPLRAQPAIRVERPAQAAAVRHIEQQLEVRGSFAFIETPLEDVVQHVAEQFKIPIVLDRRALDDDGIGRDTPVTSNLDGVTLESFLDAVLPAAELSWTVRDGVLLVTTPHGEEMRLITRLYPVRDLVLFEYERTIVEDYDTLIETITGTIAPDSWEDVGGPGAIREFPNAFALVVSQTFRIHRQVETLLDSLRQARRVQGLGDVQLDTTAPSSDTLAVPLAPFVQPAPRRYHALPANHWRTPRVHE